MTHSRLLFQATIEAHSRLLLYPTLCRRKRGVEVEKDDDDVGRVICPRSDHMTSYHVT
jgi:hypothetical protein